MQTLWEKAEQITHDSEFWTRIIGVEHQMSTFNFVFGVVLGEWILKYTDNLNKTLQSPSLTVADAHSIEDLICKTLELICNEECFGRKSYLYTEVLKPVSHVYQEREKLLYRTLEVGTSEHDFHVSPKEHFKVQYLKLLI